MENEIRVGEYIRSDLGSIGKVTRIEDNTTTKFYYEDKELITIDKRVVKHSPNLIDLIQCGDYVNGYKVLYVCNEEPCPSGKYVDIDCDKPSEESYFFDNQIKSIVTKEQFEDISYKATKM